MDRAYDGSNCNFVGGAGTSEILLEYDSNESCHS